MAILQARRGPDGLTTYAVVNDQGLILLVTRDGLLAREVASSAGGIAPDLRLAVGGDTEARRGSLWRKVAIAARDGRGRP